MEQKYHHRTPDVLEAKYKKMGMNACVISFVGSLAAGGSGNFPQTVDRGIEFYPRELRAHGWETGDMTFAKKPFLITNIQLGTTVNHLYGGGIYSDILDSVTAGPSRLPFAFTGHIEANRNIVFSITNLHSAGLSFALYLIGELKPLYK